MAEQDKDTLQNVDTQPNGDAELADSAPGRDSLEAELEAAQARVRELEDQLLRRAAEFQNYRRRVQEDLSSASERGRAEFAAAIVGVLDDLRRSREAAEAAASEGAGGPLYQSLKEGVDLVYRKFEDVLGRFDVHAIEAVGKPFDEELHEALMQQADDDIESGIVVAEIQKGYTMGGRVLRHAQVVVSQ